MNIIITGATSEIGLAIIRRCLYYGDNILAVVRPNSENNNRLPNSDKITVIYSELKDLDKIDNNNETYDVLYHLGWAYTDKKNRLDYDLQENNIKYSLSAVRFAEKYGCKTFIGAGSQAEYGIRDEILRPDSVPNPVTAYGIAKYSSYLMTKSLCDEIGIRHIWCRIFSVYGVDDNRNTLVNYAINQLLSNKKLALSKADKYWNYLFEDDAGTMMRLLSEPSVTSGVYLIANPNSCVLKDYIIEILKIFHKEKMIDIYCSKIIEMPYGLQADIRKTIESTGFNSFMPFHEGILKIVANRKYNRYDQDINGDN